MQTSSAENQFFIKLYLPSSKNVPGESAFLSLITPSSHKIFVGVEVSAQSAKYVACEGKSKVAMASLKVESFAHAQLIVPINNETNIN